jgi:hypothetical protein
MPDILVNDTEWTSLSEDMRSQISNIVSTRFPDANIVPDPSGVSATLATQLSAQGDADANAEANIAQAAGIPLATGENQPCIDHCNSVRDIALAACVLFGRTENGCALSRSHAGRSGRLSGRVPVNRKP